MPCSRTPSGMLMDMVHPGDLLRRLGRWDVEVYDDRLLVVTYHDAGKRFVPARVDLLMGNERWHVDEVPRSSFGYEFQALSPPHPRSAADHVDDALQLPVVVGTGFGIRVDRGGACPQLIGASCSVSNSRRTCHTRRLGVLRSSSSLLTIRTPR